MRPPFVFRFGVLLLALGLVVPAFAQSSAGTSVPAMQATGARVAAPSRGADRPSLRRVVTLSLVDVPLETALEEIARQAGLTLGYAPDVLPKGTRVTLRVENRLVGEALAEVLRGTDLDVRAFPGGQVALVRRPESRAREETSQTGTIAGRVTDAATGVGLSGASVRVDAMRRGTLTGSDGNYRIEGVPVGTQTLVASMIGYASETRAVTVGEGATITSNFALSISAVPLDQVVVTGTMAPAEVREIPTPISVVTAEEIRTRNIQRVDQLFRGTIPGVVAPDLGGNDFASWIKMRGSTVLEGQPRVKTYIDGIEVADPYYLSNLDPNLIERIEVTRGPQASTMYGSGAIDGVIQIFTKKGHLGVTRPQVRGQVAVGALGRRYESGLALRGDHSIQMDGGSDSFSYSAGGSYQAVGEWIPEYSSRVTGLNAGAQISHGSITAGLSARFGSSRRNAPWVVTLRDAGYLSFSKPPNTRYEVAQQTFGLTLNHVALSWWQHRLTVGYDGSDFDRYRTAPRLTTPADTLLDVLSASAGRTSASYASLIEIPIGANMAASIAAGLDYSSFNHSQFSASRATRTKGDIDGPSTVSRLPSENAGIFSQVRISLGDAFFVTGGVRAERNSNFGSDFGTDVAPRIGAAYTRDLGALTLKARTSYGEATRPPNVEYQQQLQTATRRQVPNPKLAPERQRGWDAGMELYTRNGSSLVITHYNQVAEDLIQGVIIDAASQPITLQFQNVGRINNIGWEVEGKVRLAAAVLLSGTYTRMQSIVDGLSPTYTGDLEVGDRLRGVPQHVAGAALSASSHIADVRIEMTHMGRWTEIDFLEFFRFVYGGEPYRGSIRRYVMDYPAFTKYSISASRTFSDRLGMFLRIDNVTNSYAFERNNIEDTTGRVTTLGVRWSY